MTRGSSDHAAADGGSPASDGARPQEPARCQAQPAAARPGYREDMLCASLAKTTVEYRGAHVPVCRMHSATYAAWGDDAEANAEERWGWSPATVLTVDEAELPAPPPRRRARG